jgi:hypothetical protein
MEAFLARDLGELNALLLPALKTHLALLEEQKHAFYGYALSFGLESNLSAPVPLTSTLQDFEEEPGDPDFQYMFYATNEWQHRWDDLPCFAKLDAWVRAREQENAELHAPLEDPENLDWDAFEHRHHRAHQQAVLGGLISAREQGLFKPETLVLIDISGSAWDTGEAIVEQSVKRLNSAAHAEAFVRVLVD